MRPAGRDGLGRQHIHNSLLERRGDSRDGYRLTRPVARFQPPGHRGLQPAEGEVERTVARLRARERDRGAPVTSRLVNGRPAGERHPEQPGNLVVCLARGVVDRGPERDHRARGEVRHQQQGGMPAGDQQRHGRAGQWPVLKGVHRDMRGQMMDPVKRDAERERVCLGRGHSDEQRPGQARTSGDRDRVHITMAQPRLGQRPVDSRHHRLDVRTGGDLRNHPAVTRVLVHG